MYKYLLLALLSLCVFAPEASAVYDPASGRWLTRDPAGYVDGQNLYRYGQSNPVVNSDPMGLKTKKIIATFHGQDFFGLEGIKGASAAGLLRSSLIPKLQAIPDSVVGGPFSEDSDNGNAIVRWFENQIQSATQNGFCDQQLFLVGHSNGGDAARKIAKYKFPRNSWEVELLATVDPVEKPIHNWKSVRPVGSATKDWINYYQRDDTASFFIPFFPGPEFRLQGYQLEGGPSHNIQEHYTPGFGGPHSLIMIDSAVTGDIASRIRSK